MTQSWRPHGEKKGPKQGCQDQLIGLRGFTKPESRTRSLWNPTEAHGEWIHKVQLKLWLKLKGQGLISLLEIGGWVREGCPGVRHGLKALEVHILGPGFEPGLSLLPLRIGHFLFLCSTASLKCSPTPHLDISA